MSSLHGPMVADYSVKVKSGLFNRGRQFSLMAEFGAIGSHSLAHLAAGRVGGTKVSVCYIVQHICNQNWSSQYLKPD